MNILEPNRKATMNPIITIRAERGVAQISTTKWNRLTSTLAQTAKQYASNTPVPYSNNDFATKSYAILFRIQPEQIDPLLRELASIQAEHPIRIQALNCSPFPLPVT